MSPDEFDADLHGAPADPGRQTLSVQVTDHGPGADDAVARLAQALSGATFSEIDPETRFMDVSFAAASHDKALRRLIDAIASAGADDHLVIAER